MKGEKRNELLIEELYGKNGWCFFFIKKMEKLCKMMGLGLHFQNLCEADRTMMPLGSTAAAHNRTHLQSLSSSLPPFGKIGFSLHQKSCLFSFLIYYKTNHN